MNIASPPGSTPLGRQAPFWRRTAFLSAAILTLVAAFYIVENWRGRRAWAKCQQQLRAKGEQLDWASYLPAHVPDEQNFIKTPLLEAVGYRGRIVTNAWRPLAEAGRCLVWDAWVDSQAGKKMDWGRCQAALRSRTNLHLLPLPQAPAADLLQALGEVEPQLEQLRLASLKPGAQFDIDRTAPFEESPDFNFVAVRLLCQILAYHACAELALDHRDKAFADIRVIHRLSDSLKGENTLVALMIRVAVQGLALEPFWEGWSEKRWSERELAGFEELFGRVDLLPEYNRVMRAERAGITLLVEKYGIQRNELSRVTMRSDPVSPGWWGALRQQSLRLAWKFVPRGWVCQNLVSYNHRIENFILPSLQSNPPTVSPAQVEQIKEPMPGEAASSVYGWMSRNTIPNFAKALETVARIQTFVNQARIVCALERCRSARGRFPESLSELAPQFIAQVPADVINGGPMKYRRTNDAGFALYSVGWNETDDGGISARTRDTGSKPDFRQGDWVWRFPVEP